MAWNYLKAKTVATPDAQRNNKSVKTEKVVKDKNSVKSGAVGKARSQKPVTWSQYVVWISKNGDSGGR